MAYTKAELDEFQALDCINQAAKRREREETSDVRSCFICGRRLKKREDDLCKRCSDEFPAV